MRNASLLVVVALALVGCGGPKVRDAEVVTATPAMISICGPERGGIQAATALAQRHCMAQGADAAIVGRGQECTGTDGRALGSEFTYRCVR